MKIVAVMVGIGAISGIYFSRLGASKDGQALKGFLHWSDLKLKKSMEVAEDAKKYTFEFPNFEDLSGARPGSFVIARIRSNGKTVVRPYTPISDINTKGEISFVIKTYPNGQFSQKLWNLEVGDTVSFMGPIQAYKYKPNETKRITLIGGGAGITPLYQLLQSISNDPTDKTEVELFYGSKKDDGILLKSEIDTIVSQNPEKFKVHYFVSHPSGNWKGLKGRISKEYLQENLKREDTKVFVCGPPGFYKSICGIKPNPFFQGRLSGILLDLGLKQQDVFKF